MSRKAENFSHYVLRRQICDQDTLKAAQAGDRTAQLEIWRNVVNNDLAMTLFAEYFGIDLDDLDIFGEPNLA